MVREPQHEGPALDPATVPEIRGSRYPEPFRSRMGDRARQRLGQACGLTHFGVNLVTLGPGAQSALRHWHSHEDEFVYILSGELVLVSNAGEQVVRAGMCAGYPAGREDGHHLINRSGQPAQYVEIGSDRSDDMAYYPDDDMAWRRTPQGLVGVHKDGTPYDQSREAAAPRPRAEVSVRVATDAEQGPVTALLMLQMRDHRIPISEADLGAAVAARLRDPDSLLLVAAAPEGLAGVAYVGYVRPLEHVGEVAFLEEIFVPEPWRCRGVGARLLEAVREHATARGCVSIDLEVDEDHQQAINLYHRAGFRSMRRTHFTCPLKDWDW